MKKIFMIFCCVCILEIVPRTCFSIDLSMSDLLTLSDDGYHNRGRCTIQTKCESDEEYIHTNGKCYISDDDGGDTFCEDQAVCILGRTEEKEHSKIDINRCWYAITDGDDYWLLIDNKIPDCQKYPKAPNKYPVFLTNDNKILSDNTGKIAKSIVSSQNSRLWLFEQRISKEGFENLMNEYNIKCIAYISDSDLPNNVSSDDGSGNGPGDEPDDGDNSGGSGSGDETSGGGTAQPTQPDDKKIHRHTVQTWLDALDAYRATCKKQ